MERRMKREGEADADWLESINQTNIRYDAVWSMGSNKIFKDSDYYSAYLAVLGQKGTDCPTERFQPAGLPNMDPARTEAPQNDPDAWMQRSELHPTYASRNSAETTGAKKPLSPPTSPRKGSTLAKPTSPRAASMDSTTVTSPPPKTIGETYLDMLEVARDLHFKPPVYMRIPKFNY